MIIEIEVEVEIDYYEIHLLDLFDVMVEFVVLFLLKEIKLKE